MASESEATMDYGDCIDQATFEQILEMDEDDDEREFSRSIVYGFFEQAEQTFRGMEQALKDKDLEELSRLGHFLKGSSATLGLNKVRDDCEKIQHFGGRKMETGNPPNNRVSDDQFLARIRDTFDDLKSEYIEAEKRLRKFYEKNG